MATGERFTQDCILSMFASERVSFIVRHVPSTTAKWTLLTPGKSDAHRYVDEILATMSSPIWITAVSWTDP